MTLVKIVVADSRTLFRQGVAAMLDAEDDFQVVGEAADSTQTVNLCSRLQPDVVVIDAAIPEHEGTDLGKEIAAIRVMCPGTSIVMLGESDSPARSCNIAERDRDAELERRMLLSLGATACIRPIVDRYELARALRCIVLDQRRLAAEPGSRISAGSCVHGDKHEFTSREKQVLRLLATGLSNKEIAYRLGISTQTIKNHVSHMLEKAGLQDRTQLAIYAASRKPPHPEV